MYLQLFTEQCPIFMIKNRSKCDINSLTNYYVSLHFSSLHCSKMASAMMNRPSISTANVKSDTKAPVKNADYFPELFKFLEHTQKKGLFTDFTIVIGKLKFPCHKFVLINLSEYFRAFLDMDVAESSSTMTIHESPEVNSEMMSLILDYAYSGEIEVTKNNVQDLAISSNYLGISFVKDTCEFFLLKSASKDNCFDMMLFSDAINMDKLWEACSTIFRRHFDVLSQTKQFLELPTRFLLDLAKDNKLILFSEKEIDPIPTKEREKVLLKAILKYLASCAKNEPLNPEHIELFSAVRLPTVEEKYLDHQLSKYKKVNSVREINDLCKLAKSFYTEWQSQDNKIEGLIAEGYPSYWFTKRCPASHRYVDFGPYVCGREVGRSCFSVLENQDEVMKDPFAKIKRIRLWQRKWDGRDIIGGILIEYWDGLIVKGGYMPEK